VIRRWTAKGERSDRWRQRDEGKRFVVHADEKLTAFLELDSAIPPKGDRSSFSNNGRILTPLSRLWTWKVLPSKNTQFCAMQRESKMAFGNDESRGRSALLKLPYLQGNSAQPPLANRLRFS
jgi:hypothetical protein